MENKKKRTRTSSYSKVERRPGAVGDAVRRSFNPNFTPDNRPAWEGDKEKPERRERDFNRERPDYNRERPADNREKGAYGKPRPGYDKDRGGYGKDKPGFAKDKPGYGKDKPAYSKDKPAYGKPRPERDYDGKPGRKFDGKPGYDRKPGFKKDKRDDQPKYDKDNYPRFSAPVQDKPVRLNRFIAQSGMCSRREADTYIASGVVSVNGKIVTELGTKVLPTDNVQFHDQTLKGEKKVYIVMNKPKGYATTIEDPHADKIVMDLLKEACHERVYPVGRLDKNSMGVLLFTNDGDLTKRLTHPSFNKKKIYQVTLDKALTKADMDQISKGIELEDGPIAADDISYVKENRKEIGIEIHSGRNRVVRRMFEALGYKVQKLDRVYFAGLTKQKLKRGGWRFLTPVEVGTLKSGAYE